MSAAAQTVTVQDNKREHDIASKFNLTLGVSRIGADATDELSNAYEFKTTTKASVSTARDFGPKHIARWSDRFWIVSKGRNLKTGFVHDEIYFLSRQHMNGWYEPKMARFRTVIRENELVMNRLDDLDPKQRAAISRRLDRGMLENDPNISWKYITENGIKITENHAETLRQLVAQYPLDACAPVTL